MSTDRPPLDDPRWQPAEDTPADDHHVHQQWRLVDEHGTEHTNTEEWVNRRARTERPPT